MQCHSCWQGWAHLQLRNSNSSVEPAQHLWRIAGAGDAHLHNGIGDNCHLVVHDAAF